MDILLPLVNMSSSMGLDWDDQTDQLFWTDIFLDSISVSKIDVSAWLDTVCTADAKLVVV